MTSPTSPTSPRSNDLTTHDVAWTRNSENVNFSTWIIPSMEWGMWGSGVLLKFQVLKCLESLWTLTDRWIWIGTRWLQPSLDAWVVLKVLNTHQGSKSITWVCWRATKETPKTGWWYTYPSEKWWSSSIGIMRNSQYDGKVIIQPCSSHQPDINHN